MCNVTLYINIHKYQRFLSHHHMKQDKKEYVYTLYLILHQQKKVFITLTHDNEQQEYV
jgi:hypothetical protein